MALRHAAKDALPKDYELPMLELERARPFIFRRNSSDANESRKMVKAGNSNALSRKYKLINKVG